MEDYSYIVRNYDRIHNDISDICAVCNRKEPDIVYVTKQASDDELRFLCSLGIGDIGENRAAQFSARYDMLGSDRPRMHLVGSLQSNKVKYIIGKTALIHSLDSASVLKELDRLGKKNSTVSDVLIEINSGREENKGGILPEAAEEFADSISEYPSVRLCGLMTMAPICENPSDYNKYFALTRKIFENLGKYYRTDSPVLSMGMSGSYRQAIEEGATMIRIGRALFQK